MPVNAKIHSKEVARVFKNAGVRMVFVSEKDKNNLERTLGVNTHS